MSTLINSPETTDMDVDDVNDGNTGSQEGDSAMAGDEKDDSAQEGDVGDDAQGDDMDREEEDDEAVVQAAPPEAKYKMLDRVLARDPDGLIYTAIVRRALYGPHFHKQIQVGMIANQKELDECLKEIDEGDAENKPVWHYFVHYLKWKVNWDRWVSEDDIMPLTDENNIFAEKVLSEHRALQKQFKADLAGRRRGSGHKPTVDGGAFLRVWTQRLRQLQSERNKVIEERQKQLDEQERQERELQLEEEKRKKEEEEMAMLSPSRRSTRPKKATPKWSEKQLEAAKREEEEKQKRQKREQEKSKKAKQEEEAATAKKKQAQTKLKKVDDVGMTKQMVQKEQKLRKSDLSCVIGVTNSASGHPAMMHDSGTLLNKFKITLPFSLKKVLVEEWEVVSTCHMVPNLPAKITVRQALKQYLDSKLTTTNPQSTELGTDAADGGDVKQEKADEGHSPMDEINSTEDRDKVHVDGGEDTNGTDPEKTNNEWADMVDGIALIFDQALSFRLLYHQEIPQYNIIMRQLNKRTQQKEKEQMEQLRKKRQQPDLKTQEEHSEVAGTPTDDVTAVIKQEEEGSSKPSHDEFDASKKSEVQDQMPEVASSTTVDLPKNTVEAASSSKTSSDEAIDVPDDATPSDIYGCEHLLRLFLRLPALLADDQHEQRKRHLKRKAAAEARRKNNLFTQQQRPQQDVAIQDGDEEKKEDDNGVDKNEDDDFVNELQQRNVRIIAKVNDFVRFLHKHQETLFAQSYRRMNLSEEREQTRLQKRRIAAANKRYADEPNGNDGSASAEVEEVPAVAGADDEGSGAETKKRVRESDRVLGGDKQARKKKRSAHIPQQ